MHYDHSAHMNNEEISSTVKSQFSDHQFMLLINTLRASGALGLVGSLFIVISFLWIGRKSRQFPQHLIFWLGLSDGALALSLLMGTFKDPKTGLSVTWCHIQAFNAQFWALANILWVLVIAVKLYLRYRFDVEAKVLQEWHVPSHCLCWGLPAITCLVITAIRGWGSGPAWCWIGGDDRLFIARFVGFYLYVIGVFLAILIIYIMLIARILKRAPKVFSSTVLEDLDDYFENEQSLRKKITFRVSLYLLSFIIAWGGGLVNRVYGWWTGGHVSFVLWMIQVACVPVQGIFDAIVYGLNRNTVLQYKEFFCGAQMRRKSYSATLNTNVDETDVEPIFYG